MHHRIRTDTCRQRSLMRLSSGSWPGWSPGSPLTSGGSWLPWPTASEGDGLEPFQRERAWRGSDLIDEGVPGDDRTWLARRPGGGLDRGDHAG
jgi:hypothetical protein